MDTLPSANQPGVESLSRRSTLVVLGLAVIALALAMSWPERTVRSGGFLLDAEGRPAKLGERTAPVTLLHFWATWCPPCMTELPSLNELGAQIGREDFAILMVAVQDDAEKVQSFLGSRAQAALYDPDWDVAHRFETFKLPETHLLIGNEVVDKYIGAQAWNSPEIRRRLEAKIREHYDPAFTMPALR